MGENIMTALQFDNASATTGQGLTRSWTSTDDPQTQSWDKGAQAISRLQLIGAARQKINRLLRLESGWDGHRAKPPTPIAGMVLNGVLERLLFDDCATPQIAPLPDGGLEVDWLVGGNSVHVEASPEGEVFLDVHTASGVEEASGEFSYWRIDNHLLGLAETFLHKISQDVKTRLLAR